MPHLVACCWRSTIKKSIKLRGNNVQYAGLWNATCDTIIIPVHQVGFLSYNYVERSHSKKLWYHYSSPVCYHTLDSSPRLSSGAARRGFS